MKRVLLSGLRANLSRLAATGLAVILSVGFVVATLTLSATFTQTTQDTLVANMSHADVLVAPTGAMVASSDPRTSTDILLNLLPVVTAVDHVASADVERLAFVDLGVGDTRAAAQVSSLLIEPVRWQTLAGGTWPSAETEATIDAAAAESLGVIVGQTVSITPAGGGIAPIDVTIVGITTAAAPGVGTGAPTLVMVPDALAGRAMFAVSTGILVNGDGQDTTALVDGVRAAIADTAGVVVQTTTDAVDSKTADMSGSASIISSILLAFAVVALFVAGMVIANTFQVLVSQRSRELALLRCVGASIGQVRRLILGEALVLGLVASAIGVAAGVWGAGLVAELSRSGASAVHLGDLVVNPSLLVVGFILGTLLTVVSALSPARRATRVRPVAALRATDDPVSPRAGVARFVVAMVLLGAGAAGLVAGATRYGLPVGVPAGMISFLGILLASSVLIPWIVRIAGTTISWISVPAHLAALNATRNPRRTASTAAALLVGVTLVTMMVVGVTSVRTSVNDKIDEKRPVDLSVASSDPAGLTPPEITSIGALGHVVATTSLTSGRLSLTTDHTEPLVRTSRGVDPGGALDVARSNVSVPTDGTIQLNPLDAPGIGTGETVTVTGDFGSADLVAEVTYSAPQHLFTVTAHDLATLVAAPVVYQVQVRLADEVSSLQVQQTSSSILSLNDTFSVGGGAPERTYYAQILDIMLLIVLSLLTIAVVIAIVGIGNTLALSVIERRRESALLRALGLTRGQLRRMLGTEAVLITAVAAMSGIGLGIFYAWAGLSAVGLEASKLELGISLPWEQLGADLLGPLVAGLIASVVPARGATRKSPIEGLAAV